jgi:hypothetical protein
MRAFDTRRVFRARQASNWRTIHLWVENSEMRTQRSREAEVGGEVKDRFWSLECSSRPISASLRLCVQSWVERRVKLTQLTPIDRIRGCAERTQLCGEKRKPRGSTRRRELSHFVAGRRACEMTERTQFPISRCFPRCDNDLRERLAQDWALSAKRNVPECAIHHAPDDPGARDR